MKTLAEKQGPYEELTEKGRELLDKSDESEQHGINAIILNLAEAWEQVCEELVIEPCFFMTAPPLINNFLSCARDPCLLRFFRLVR